MRLKGDIIKPSGLVTSTFFIHTDKRRKGREGRKDGEQKEKGREERKGKRKEVRNMERDNKGTMKKFLVYNGKW